MKGSEKIHFAVQASSTSWSGSKDICMNELNEVPVVVHTLKHILKNCENASLSLIAPEFDKTGYFNQIPLNFGIDVKLIFAFDESPLKRMVSAFQHLADSEFIVRVDGVNFNFDTDSAIKMLELAKQSQLDCVKFPDDYPINFTCDVYRIGALRKLLNLLNGTSTVYSIHPKYYMLIHPEIFKFEYFNDYNIPTDDFLKSSRTLYADIYNEREGSQKKRITTGDQQGFHYEIVLTYLTGNMTVLDIACGVGYGTNLLAQKVQKVIGVDIDEKTIDNIKEEFSDVKNLEFCLANVLQTGFEYDCFDLIASMETIEHIPDEHQYLQEMKRILKPNGYFIFSTPQNRLGHIPMNNNHIKEYRLDELIELTEQYFKIEKTIGIKQGRIVIEGNNSGTNTMLICRKQ